MSKVAACLVALASLPSTICTGTPSGVLLNYDRVAQLIVEASQMPDESSRSLVQGTGVITTPPEIDVEKTTLQTTSTEPPTTKPTTSTVMTRKTSTQQTTTLPSTSTEQTTTATRTSTSETMSSTATSTTTKASTSTSETTMTATSTTPTRTRTSHTATSTSTETATSSTATTTATVTFTSTATSTRSTTTRSTTTWTVTLTATTITATTTSTTSRTQTSTSTFTTFSTTTTSLTATATSTSSSSATETQTTTVTTTRTKTTTTISTSSSSTTTPYCFESNVHWGPIDMPGTLPSKESDEFACQEKCSRKPGCSHFSFWQLGGMCHLQDRYAQRRENREGFISGPFQCWSYLVPGQYAMMSNTSYVPVRFRCMQTGVTWSPDMSASKYFKGDRDEVVFACQQKCRDTDGCAHFTVMFPGLCRLAGNTSVPLPAEQAISGPPTQDCADPAADAPMGHTFMRKYESSPALSTSSPLLRIATVGPAALMVSAAAVALLWRRRWSSSTLAIPIPLSFDLEESLQHCPQE